MSAVYPRTITITRRSYSQAAGTAMEQSTTTIVTSAEARIYLKRDKGFGAPIFMPGKTNVSASMPMWIADTKLGDGVVEDGDQLVDDLGNEFKVDAAYYNGWFTQLSLTPTKPTA